MRNLEKHSGGIISCALFFSIGFIVLICWGTFQPHHIRGDVDSVILSNLVISNVSSAAEVSYSLTVNISLYNPSQRVDIYYDTIDAKLKFRDAVLSSAANNTSPSEFYQRRKTSDDVKLEFGYVTPGVSVATDVAGELEKEIKSVGSVSLELHVDLRVRYVLRIFKVRQKPKISCAMTIPVKGEGQDAGVRGAVASSDRCKVKYR
ncbi:unnamed protein product [Urochloa humidicola]